MIQTDYKPLDLYSYLSIDVYFQFLKNIINLLLFQHYDSINNLLPFVDTSSFCLNEGKYKKRYYSLFYSIFLAFYSRLSYFRKIYLYSKK